ncbi:ABC transporter permease [Aerococcus sanguinicola]|uniref:ABC transporter permease n=1 Tax=Aerococcus sanguinicola TaxID=119206 RepID=A0A2I1MQ44_9LACT|nr:MULTISPECIES: ABC transporter permease subunit [Aerococcus]OFT93330.1 ABC transporter permease [Aerococcus sp. HMSC23C02]PKZ22265.1 ABC transporter permease [Aerococcus sanguinicola]
MSKIFKPLVIFILLAYLLIPLIITIIYSFSSSWTFSVLPDSLTLKWYIQLFSDPEFLMAIARTVFLATVTVILSLAVIVPTIFAIAIYFPKLMKYINLIIIFCYSLPGVISVMSLSEAYNSIGVPKMILLFGSYVVGTLPLMTLGTTNSLRSINAKELIESAEILGASKLESFTKIILPNISNGVISSALFIFSGLFAEYVTVNLLLGGKFTTIQIYLREQLTANGHYSSAIVVTYFTLATLFTVIALVLVNRKRVKKI